ncbi:MAG: hypothetical protein MZV49_08845 [Rhodopseudomonas palustris]|nr:hypothetical protein [Rhodopseudomonas palustris]
MTSRTTRLALLAVTGAVVCAFFLAAAWGGFAGRDLAPFAPVLGLLLCADAALHASAERQAPDRNLVEFSAETNRAILLNESQERIFEAILDFGLRILDKANLGTVLTFDDEGRLVIAASRGFEADFIQAFRLPLEDSFIWRQTGGRITGPVIITADTIRSPSTRFEPRVGNSSPSSAPRSSSTGSSTA